MFFIGLDDTDTLEAGGTGHLARDVASRLEGQYRVLGVTRHQLLLSSQVPCTKRNSSAAVLVDADSGLDPVVLLERVQGLIAGAWVPGSDPGLCVAGHVPAAVTEFGRRAKQELLTQVEARALATAYGIPLVGLGGDESGVIGALASVGLAASGEDGRYVLVGRSRELSGLQQVSVLLEAGIAGVRTTEGEAVTDGLVQTDKLRPARRGGRAVVVVHRVDDYWEPLKLD
jgi:tRNA(Ile2) C34 agmatinyltransferase TiaS